MSIDSGNVTQAYLNTLRNAKAGGTEPRKAETGDFADLLNSIAKTTADAAKTSEDATFGAMAGTADVAEVVTAVTNAELALQTVVAVRDRVIQAYQDIIRMPI